MPLSLRPHPVCPFDQSRAPREPGTHTRHQNERPGLKHPVPLRVGESQRNRARGCVPVAVDVDDDLLPWNLQLLRCVINDSDVRLVRYVDVHLVHRSTASLEDPFGGVDHDTRRELEDLATVHLHVGLTIVLELARTAARKPQVLAAASVRTELEAEEAAPLYRL